MAIPKGCEQLIYHPKTDDLAEFEELAKLAKDAGFTHVIISDLGERTDYQGEDRGSPWCEWSVNFASIFKHATPPGLEEAYPAEFVRRQMKLMKSRHAIAKKLGLRAAYSGLEPHWLSERVYARHPAWRGSRCDNSLRTTGMYFAPDTDNPEVREAYRRAVKMIASECPLLDTFIFHTNDCGAGYPWTAMLYVNENGPTATINGDMGLRVAGFLKALRAGAADAGADARFFTAAYGWFKPQELHLVLRSLEPGIGINGVAPGELAGECSMAGLGGWGGDHVIEGFPTPMAVVGGAANLRSSKARRFQTGGRSKEFFTAFKAAMACPPGDTARRKLDALEKLAAALYAEDVATEVVEAWQALERASIQEHTAGLGHMYHATVMLRWLVRPLVPHQGMLTSEERSYWEPYIYQSVESQPESYLDYLNLTGKPVVSTWDESSFKCIAIDGIDSTLRSAANMLEEAAGKTASADARARLRLDAMRVRARACVMLTVRHTLQMGTLIYERDREPPKAGLVDPYKPDLSQGSMGSYGLWFMFRAMRWELDNVNELISLIESAPAPLIRHAKDKSREGALVLGPDVLDGLRKKAAIMLKYWRTAEKGYYLPTKGG